ncbi:MAG TPA: cytochrome C oxidase subunit II [Candidatus Nitrosotenuis sp.]|jgi:cytochrome c oxidase subunit 2|nr:cytochrome C oxidase subunit II [Candidatus Nitrosotenuis sp.]
MHSAIVCPEGVWWKPVPRQEKAWVTISFIWCLVLFAMMPLWHWRGGQNPSGIRGTTTAAAYRQRVERFLADYKVGTDKGLPVAAPPPGAQVYLQASMWSWQPVLRLERGVSYTLHLSSLDVNHGFSLYPLNLNFQVVPGYDYGLKITPDTAGTFEIVCNEFCGIGHHVMVGKIVVEEPGSTDYLDSVRQEASHE